MERDLNHYLNLPYTKVVRRDSEGDFVARVLELPGCVADGPTEEQALAALAEAQSLWIGDALSARHPIPEPSTDDDSMPSGKWLQRVPRSLHRKLIDFARKEAVSLNQFVTSVLAEAVGERRLAKIAEVVKPHEVDPNTFWVCYDAPAEQGEGKSWIVETKPHQRQTMDDLVFLSHLTADYQVDGVLNLASLEKPDVHGRKRLSRLSAARAAVRSGVEHLYRKS